MRQHDFDVVDIVPVGDHLREVEHVHQDLRRIVAIALEGGVEAPRGHAHALQGDTAGILPKSATIGADWASGHFLIYDARVIKPFEPRFMKVGVLTAALQELTPREVRDPDPDRAIEDWVAFARTLGADYIQLSAALHPTETDVPPEAMLDPVANTLDLRKPFDKDRARRVEAALRASRVGLSDLGYFDNLLHHDPAIRKKKHDFMLRVFDAAALLGVNAVCGFVGRNQQRTMDENLVDFEEWFVPLLKEAKSRGLTYRVEQCPMPGWTTGDNWHNNIAYAPGPLDRPAPDLREARRRGPVPHPLRSVARDPHGAGHAVDLPVPERHRLQLPHRRVPREGAGRRCRRA